MSTPTKLLIVGGSDGGVSAALRARELDPRAEVTMLLEDEFPNYSICGLPFYLSGETPDWHSLAHRTEFAEIDVRCSHRVTRIDASHQAVEVVHDGTKAILSYDKLVLGTGAAPTRPKIEGWDLPGVFQLHTMKDSFALHDYLQQKNPQRAVIIGAGYIGLEMADALTHRGIEITVVSRASTVLSTVDAELGEMVGDELRKQGVAIAAGVEAHGITESAGVLHVSGTRGFEQDCEMVLIAVGVQPRTELGVAAGLALGTSGAFLVNRRMESTLPHVYVAGDCGETWHRQLNRHVYLPLGTTAHKQGRVAGENALGGKREFAGSLGTQVVKLFDLVIARTGLREDEAAREGFSVQTTGIIANDHKAYYPGATPLHLRVTGDLDTGKLLGAQMLGRWGAEVSKRVDIFASALFQGMTVDQVSDLDLSYTPPLSSPWDPVQMACQAWNIHFANHFGRTNV